MTSPKAEITETAETVETRVTDPSGSTSDLRRPIARVGRRVSGALKTVGRSATAVLDRLPATLDATRGGAQGTTRSLQTLPDPTLRALSATSLGLGAGFYLAGAPRLAVAAGVAPALIMGVAMLLRPIVPTDPTSNEVAPATA